MPSKPDGGDTPVESRAFACPGVAIEAGGWFPAEGLLKVDGESWRRAPDPAIIAGLRLQLAIDPAGFSLAAAARRALSTTSDADWTLLVGLGRSLSPRGPLEVSAGLVVGATHETWQTATPYVFLAEDPPPAHPTWLPVAEGLVTLAWPRQAMFQGVARGSVSLATVVDVGDEWSSGWSALVTPGAGLTLGLNYVPGYRRQP